MRSRTQCHLCHGHEPGIPNQAFPVGDGTYAVGGYLLCDVHVHKIEEVAKTAGAAFDVAAARRPVRLSLSTLAQHLRDSLDATHRRIAAGRIGRITEAY